jgi:hypothetical protein
MNSDVLKALSVWSSLTGLVLAIFYFTTLWLEVPTPAWLPMLIAIIGGYELFNYGQELKGRREIDGPHG